MNQTDVINPRFPHTCKIVRAVNSVPMEDVGLNDDPMADNIGTEEGNAQSEKIIYEGICRSYNRETVSGNGDVITSYRGLALPIKQDEWTEETAPAEGDMITVWRKGYIETGNVLDKTPGNFGTHIVWKYVRN